MAAPTPYGSVVLSQAARILPLDRIRNVSDGPHQRLEGLADPHLVDRAEQIEELQLRLAGKADQPRHHPAMSGVAFQIFAGVQRQFLAQPALNRSAHEFRHHHLVFEGLNLQADFLVKDAIEHAGHLGNHGEPL